MRWSGENLTSLMKSLSVNVKQESRGDSGGKSERLKDGRRWKRTGFWLPHCLPCMAQRTIYLSNSVLTLIYLTPQGGSNFFFYPGLTSKVTSYCSSSFCFLIISCKDAVWFQGRRLHPSALRPGWYTCQSPVALLLPAIHMSSVVCRDECSEREGETSGVIT